MSEKDLIFIFLVLLSYYWTTIFSTKVVIYQVGGIMAQKKLEKGSAWELLDKNGDGIVSDKELEIRERMVLLENRDKKEDQQRHLVWFSALTVTVFIVVLMTPVVPIDRIDQLEWYW